MGYNIRSRRRKRERWREGGRQQWEVYTRFPQYFTHNEQLTHVRSVHRHQRREKQYFSSGSSSKAHDFSHFSRGEKQFTLKSERVTFWIYSYYFPSLSPLFFAELFLSTNTMCMLLKFWHFSRKCLRMIYTRPNAAWNSHHANVLKQGLRRDIQIMIMRMEILIKEKMNFW